MPEECQEPSKTHKISVIPRERKKWSLSPSDGTRTNLIFKTSYNLYPIKKGILEINLVKKRNDSEGLPEALKFNQILIHMNSC